MTDNTPQHWRPGCPLADLSSWKIGGPARYYAAPPTTEALRADLRFARTLGLPVLAIGGASNLLFSDRGYEGLVLALPRLTPPLEEQLDAAASREPEVWLPGGGSLTDTVAELARLGLAGLEWSEGIPGSVGGAIVNNAGAYGGQIADTLDRVRVMLADGSTEEWSASRLGLAYRRSNLKGSEPTAVFLLAGRFRLHREEPAEIIAKMKEIRSTRDTKLPREPSCGCVFRNPEGAVAGQLIEEAGLSGHRRGDAMVSPQHANFIVNLGRARANDVRDLIHDVQEAVFAKSGRRLQLEVQPVGFSEELLTQSQPG